MANSYYEINCINEELEIYSVRKRSSGTVYYVTKTDDGTWIHDCKAISVYGNNYMCRHKKLVIQRFYANPDHKHLFNISPKRSKKSGQSQGA
jgi:hypothetical protein